MPVIKYIFREGTETSPTEQKKRYCRGNSRIARKKQHEPPLFLTGVCFIKNYSIVPVKFGSKIGRPSAFTAFLTTSSVDFNLIGEPMKVIL